MGRAPCCSKVGLHKGPWSTKEDNLLTNYIQEHGEGQWRSLPKKAGLLRCGKSCRLRWMNYLRPGIKRGNISPDEEDLIVRLHSLLGNRWSLIAGRLPGRTDNEIKNYWNTHLLKKLKNAGIEPKSKKNAKRTRQPKEKSQEIRNAASKNNRKKKQNKKKNDDADDSDHKGIVEEVNKTKVYLPKPIRVSSAISRNSSFEFSAGSVSSSSGEVDKEANKTEVSYIPWPLFEFGDASYGEDQVYDEVFINGYDQPLIPIHSSDHMLEKVYDEYLQLL